MSRGEQNIPFSNVLPPPPYSVSDDAGSASAAVPLARMEIVFDLVAHYLHRDSQNTPYISDSVQDILLPLASVCKEWQKAIYLAVYGRGYLRINSTEKLAALLVCATRHPRVANAIGGLCVQIPRDSFLAATGSTRFASERSTIIEGDDLLMSFVPPAVSNIDGSRDGSNLERLLPYILTRLPKLRTFVLENASELTTDEAIRNISKVSAAVVSATAPQLHTLELRNCTISTVALESVLRHIGRGGPFLTNLVLHGTSALALSPALVSRGIMNNWFGLSETLASVAVTACICKHRPCMGEIDTTEDVHVSESISADSLCGFLALGNRPIARLACLSELDLSGLRHSAHFVAQLFELIVNSEQNSSSLRVLRIAHAVFDHEARKVLQRALEPLLGNAGKAEKLQGINIECLDVSYVRPRSAIAALLRVCPKLKELGVSVDFEEGTASPTSDPAFLTLLWLCRERRAQPSAAPISSIARPMLQRLILSGHKSSLGVPVRLARVLLGLEGTSASANSVVVVARQIKIICVRRLGSGSDLVPYIDITWEERLRRELEMNDIVDAEVQIHEVSTIRV